MCCKMSMQVLQPKRIQIDCESLIENPLQHYIDRLAESYIFLETGLKLDDQSKYDRIFTINTESYFNELEMQTQSMQKVVAKPVVNKNHNAKKASIKKDMKKVVDINKDSQDLIDQNLKIEQTNNSVSDKYNNFFTKINDFINIYNVILEVKINRNDKFYTKFLEKFEDFSNIKYLQIKNVSTCMNISEVFEKNLSNLILLDVSYNNIEHLDFLNNISLSFLHSLDLSGNKLWMYGSGLKKLHNLPVLKSLNLGYNNLQDEGLRYIFPADTDSRDLTIETLYLHGNKLTNEGLNCLSVMRKHLKYLDLNSNNINGEGLGLLSRYLSKSLIHLFLSNNKLECIKNFTKHKWRHLEVLDINNCNLGPEGVHQLLQSTEIIEEIVENTTVAVRTVEEKNYLEMKVEKNEENIKNGMFDNECDMYINTFKLEIDDDNIFGQDNNDIYSNDTATANQSNKRFINIDSIENDYDKLVKDGNKSKAYKTKAKDYAKAKDSLHSSFTSNSEDFGKKYSYSSDSGSSMKDYDSYSNSSNSDDLELKNQKRNRRHANYKLDNNFPALKTLIISYNNAKNKGLNYLKNINLPKLKTLNLKNNQIDSEGAEFLKQFKIRKITNLILNANAISVMGVKSLTESKLAANLTRLDLGNCKIQSEGVMLLATCEELGNIRELILSYNGIKASGLKSLATSSCLPKLRQLDLQYNGFGYDDAINMLQTMTIQLVSLNMVGNSFSQDELLKLYKMKTFYSSQYLQKTLMRENQDKEKEKEKDNNENEDCSNKEYNHNLKDLKYFILSPFAMTLKYSTC